MIKRQLTKTPVKTLTEDQKIGLFQEIAKSLSLWSFNNVTWKTGRVSGHYSQGHYVGQSIMISNNPYTFIFIDSDDIGEFDRLSL